MAMTDWQPSPDQMRARYPDREGTVSQNGCEIFYEVYGEEHAPGDAETKQGAIVFVPPWAVVHSRMWKAQIPYFARRHKVIVYDPRGNGRSGRPQDVEAHSEIENARDIGAVLDATGTGSATIVTMSRGCQRSLIYADENPDRVDGVVFMSCGTVTAPSRANYRETIVAVLAQQDVADEMLPAVNYFNEQAWLRDPANYRRFLDRFFESFFEPHSTKGIEDGIAWGLDTDPRTLALTHYGWQPDGKEARERAARLACPTLVIHGTEDRVTPFEEGESLAEALGTRLETVEGSGHGPQARKPVQVNLAIREFVEPGFERTPRPRKRGGGPKRVLFASSPIGLGHAQRDIAIARELREKQPDVEVEWLAQHPVTKVLEAEGETIHPASAALASESRHIEAESAEHDLHCFHAIRRMDEILVSNFMVFHDVLREGKHDLVIGDEAWEIDYYLHENPAEKRVPYVWLTDFVGFLPMEDGGEHEAFLTADHNAQMIEHIEAQPGVRDRAIFVGNADDIVPERFGPGLPAIRDWTERNYDFAGYVTGFDPAAMPARDELRHELGYGEDENVCIVSVGGSGVGRSLLEKVIDAHPHALAKDPSLRTIVVAGPRIDPASLPTHDRLEVVSYVHNLYRHFAACDLAVVQGGLTTSMELTANRRPFLYFPLKHHFEQNFHVRHRLGNYGAGRCMDYDTVVPEELGAAMASEAARSVSYRPVETDGAERAARSILELL